MIEFIYGTYGSGKTTRILQQIADDTSKGKKCFLIVPDQEALSFERLSLLALPDDAQLNLEILGFSRLYNRVCREYGGLSYSYLTKPMRALLMWKTLRDLSPMLIEYKNNSDPALTDLMLSALGELKAAGISASALENAQKKLPSDSTLANRLSDLSLIYSCFDNFVSEKYSDSSDDLSRLRDILREHSFFEGANVYIDSFTSFTAVEHQIIELIFKSADSTVITLPLSDLGEREISEESISRSLEKLRRSAERCGGAKETLLAVNMRANSESLSYLSKNLWKMEKNEKSSVPPDPSDRIICEVCNNPYSEAEAAAAHVLKLLKGGARAREIAIIMRDAEKYRGIIEPALEKSGIPFFFSEKSDLCSMPPVKFILSALRIKRFNWRAGDVISHLKTGLCGIDASDADLFEEYVSTWDINGQQFLLDEWTMNPDGFTDQLSPRAKNILEAANRVRSQLTEPLLKLFVLLDASESIADSCRALYKYMCDVNLEDKLAELSVKAAQRGDVKQARELSRIYGVMLSTLASVAEAVGDEEADCEELMLILKTIFDKTEIGSIPTSIDELSIGSASTFRASGIKYALIMGLCEGEFPAAVSDNGVFSEGDRAILADLDIELSGDVDSRSSDELMFVQRAFSIPSEKLILFTHTMEINGAERFPSLAFNRVKALFGKDIAHTYINGDLDYLVPAPRNAAGFWRAIKDEKMKASLAIALEEHLPGISDSLSSSANAQECKVSSDSVSNALGGSLHFSASSFEKYVRCPFSYYCSYVLKLREKITADFNLNNIGTFVHFILENLLKNAIPNDPNAAMPDDKTLIAMTDQAISEYVSRIAPPHLADSKRLAHLYKRLRTLSLLLVGNIVEEFSKSSFRPAFFELKANGKDGAPPPLVFRLDDKSAVSFSGIIDRVDVYKKENNVYIRVVDYKTGTKKFNISDIDKGINTQMLLYLFTLCRTNSAEFKRSVGIDEGGNAIPSGVIYFSTNIPAVEADDYNDGSTVLKKAASKLERSGLLLCEDDVLLAMNNELDSSFLAGIKKSAKDDTYSGSAVASSETFAELYDKLEGVICKIAAELRSGTADASPLKHNNSLPCAYCQARPICRRIERGSEEEI